MANRIYDALAPVRASEELKSSTCAYLKAERERRDSHPERFHFSVRELSLAACMVLFLTVGIGGYTVIRTPVSYISIDVNPSIELALNRMDRVVSAAAYNEDGEIVLEGVSVKGKPYAEAIDTIVESDAMSGYLSEDAVLTFTVASKNDEKEAILQEGVEQTHSCKGHGGQSANADVELVSEAHGHGVSFGKYAAYMELAQYDDSVTVEDCRDMTMTEIHHQIDAHEQHGCASGGETGGGCRIETPETGAGNRKETAEADAGNGKTDAGEKELESNTIENGSADGHHKQGCHHK